MAEEMFGDILPVKACGVMLWLALWDRIVFWRGAEKVLYSLIDEPELLHRLMTKLVDIENDYIDQLEAQNLLYTGPGAVCHCMETYVDEPYQPGFDPSIYAPATAGYRARRRSSRRFRQRCTTSSKSSI